MAVHEDAWRLLPDGAQIDFMDTTRGVVRAEKRPTVGLLERRSLAVFTSSDVRYPVG